MAAVLTSPSARTHSGGDDSVRDEWQERSFAKHFPVDCCTVSWMENTLFQHLRKGHPALATILTAAPPLTRTKLLKKEFAQHSALPPCSLAQRKGACPHNDHGCPGIQYKHQNRTV
eukprot:IDg8896t1